MPEITIYRHTDHQCIFTGDFENMKACLEAAIHQNTDLSYVNIPYTDLSNANLDDAKLSGAKLDYANLTGANLSEALLKNASLRGASLYNTCLAYSDLRGCNFEDATFGATDINGAILENTSFSTLSCFSLEFHTAKTMKNCYFKSADGRGHRISRPPVVITGLSNTPLIATDNTILHGHKPLIDARLHNILRHAQQNGVKIIQSN